MSAAQAAFDKGDFRWAAELLNHAVFGAPDHKAAKELLARTYDQLGYMAENVLTGDCDVVEPLALGALVDALAFAVDAADGGDSMYENDEVEFG